MTHTSTEQPEALRLATGQSGGKSEWADTLHAAAAELCRQHARITELEDVADMAIKRIAELEAQLSAIGAGGVEAPAAPVSTYVEVRECPDCGHVGINDADGSKAACNTCEWYGDSPREDKCPGCNRVGTMSAACPKCGSRTLLLAETHLLVAAPALAEETEAAENWRRLALQLDNHRMQAIGHLKAVTNPAACFDKYKAAKAFLNAPPLGGEEVLAQRIATLAAQTKQAAAAPAVPQGWKLVQIELLERIQESLGSFLSDQGWSQSDMDTADALGGLLAAAPQPPACNQSMQPELATYSAHARNKKGIEQ